MITGEKGQALIIVLVLMLLGGLIIAPMLAYMSTGLKVGKEVYEERMHLFYAADSGIEDALWQIKYEKLTSLFSDYDPYDYEEAYEYSLPSKVNDKDVDVTIENIWIPKDIPAPEPADAEQIIEQGKLIITGSIPTESTYQIKIFYYYDNDEDEEYLTVDTIGIWLPPSFDYMGNCSLADDDDTQLYSAPDVEYYCSGKAVVWDFASVPLINFPDGIGYPMERSFTFEFSGPEEQSLGTALSWIETSGVDGIDYTWDADTKIYKIVSTATDAGTGKQTVAEAYTTKSEMRELGSALSGDYCAIGATLLTASGDEKYRDRLFKKSSATINQGDIPADATVEAAYVYWSGWIEHGEHQMFQDDCPDMRNWIPAGDWSVHWGRFRGHHSGNESNRYLTMLDSLDLSSCSGETVTLSWEQDESGRLEDGDRLYFAFSGDDGSWSNNIEAFRNDNPDSPFSYTIPQQYLTSSFKMRFYLYGFGGEREYAYIDNIKISALERLAESKVNRVMFGTSGNMSPITADKVQVKENVDQPGTWSYSCYYDATDLVEQFIEDGEIGSNGSGTYTVGHVLEDGPEVYQLHPSGTTGYPLGTPAVKVGWSYPNIYEWAYAGWSLIIIYSSSETKGHQLYLYDDFVYSGMNQNVDFDDDGEPGGTISGFIVPEPIAGEVNAAKMTCFVGEGDDCYDGDSAKFNGDYLSNAESPSHNVWNSRSPRLAEDGIDIDTFYVSWDSGLLQPGDTSAQIDLPTETDSWNLVYIILSFRSETTTGGPITYLIRGGNE